MNCLPLFEKDVITLVHNITRKVVSELAAEYGFSEQEALQKLCTTKQSRECNNKNKKQATPKTLQKKPQIPLPFCGIIKDDWCRGVRNNYNLYTQCTNSKYKTGQLCLSCHKQSERNNGKLNHGFIQDRKPEHKKAVRYATVMKKLNITREEAEQEAARFGMRISEIEYQEKVTKRGRPRKTPKKIVSTTTDFEYDIPIKELVQLSDTDLVSSNFDAIQLPEPLPNSDDSEDEEEEIQVVEFTYKDKKYLKDGDDHLYDIDTHELIGTWSDSGIAFV